MLLHISTISPFSSKILLYISIVKYIRQNIETIKGSFVGILNQNDF